MFTSTKTTIFWGPARIESNLKEERTACGHNADNLSNLGLASSPPPTAVRREDRRLDPAAAQLSSAVWYEVDLKFTFPHFNENCF